MWVVTHKSLKYWLLPGKKFVIGRPTKSGVSEIDLQISESSVSRKHAVIELRRPTEDATLHPSVVTEVLVTDLGSSFGTFVNNGRLESKIPTKLGDTLERTHIIKLGHVSKIKLEWIPFVITYDVGVTDSSENVEWKSAFKMMDKIDVKLVQHMVRSTDVLVKSGVYKTNLFMALVWGLPVVLPSFFEAISHLAHISNNSGVESLEVDFDAFLADLKFKRNPLRASCLNGRKFVLPTLYDVWSPILTSAGAKCYETKPDGNDCVFVFRSDEEAKRLECNYEYVLEKTTLCACIVECRDITSEELRLTSAPAKRKPTETQKKLDTSREADKNKRVSGNSNILDMMISIRESQRTAPRASEGASHSDTMMSNVTYPNPGPDFDPEPNLVHKTVDLETEANLEKQSPRPGNETVKQVSPLTSDRSTYQEPQVHKKISEQSGGGEFYDDDTHTQTELDKNRDRDTEPVDYNLIGELAIVDDCLETNKPAFQDIERDQSPVIDFKAFQRYENTYTYNKPRVEYDDESKDNMSKDDEFALAEDFVVQKENDLPENKEFEDVEEDMSQIPEEEKDEPHVKPVGILADLTVDDTTNDDFGFSFD